MNAQKRFFPSRGVTPTMFWDNVSGLTTTLPNSDVFGHDNIRCVDFVLGLLWMKWFCFVLRKWVLYVWLYRDIVLKRCMMGFWWYFCIMMCAVVLVCRFIQECRRWRHRCELLGNYPVFTVVMVIYTSVWRIMHYYLTPDFSNYFIYISIEVYNLSRRTIG